MQCTNTNILEIHLQVHIVTKWLEPFLGLTIVLEIINILGRNSLISHKFQIVNKLISVFVSIIIY